MKFNWIEDRFDGESNDVLLPLFLLIDVIDRGKNEVSLQNASVEAHMRRRTGKRKEKKEGRKETEMIDENAGD